jgi:cobalt-zinc-cadmium efflux system membrane fusion protein
MMRNSLLFCLLLFCLLASLLSCRGTADKEKQAAKERASLAERASGEAKQTAPPGRPLAGSPGIHAGRVQYGPIDLSQNDKESLGISTVKASNRPVRSLLSAMGKVLAPQTRMAKVSYAFVARISAIHVRIGDWVEKGQPVLTLQSEEVGHAKSEYYKAIADLELARANYEREKRLFSRGVSAQKSSLASEAAFKVAQVNLDAAEKKLHVLGFSEANVKAISETHQINPEITLFAPISGKIVEHKIILGGMIDQTTELLTIMDPSLLWVDAEVFERDIAKIRIGQDVQITVPAYPAEAFRARLGYIGDILNPETRTITVRTEVKNTGFKLKPGMFADVTIFLNEAQEVLAVPVEAILDDRNEKLAFVKTDGQYIPRIVEVGAEHNGYCAILSGLQEGDEVVTKGNYLLKSKLHEDLLKKAGVH